MGPTVSSGALISSTMPTGKSSLRTKTTVFGDLSAATTGHFGVPRSNRERYNTSPFRMSMANVVHSVTYEFMSLLFILGNAAWVGYMSDHMAKNVLESIPAWALRVEFALVSVFFLEIALNIYVFRCWMFAKRLCFDALVFAAHCMELGMRLYHPVQDYYTFNLLAMSHTLRIARSVRIIFFFNTRQMNDFRLMVTTMSGTIKPFLATLTCVCWFVFMVAVYFTEYSLIYRLDEHRTAEGETALMLRFGTLKRSFLSLFQAITGGIDWENLSAPLGSLISPRLEFIFLVYIMFSVIAVMNAVTSVFVETTHTRANRAQDNFICERLKRIFESIDMDQSGYISFQEFSDILSSNEGVATDFRDIGLDPPEATTLFHLLDTGKDGKIGADEFLESCLKLKGAAKALDVMLILRSLRKGNQSLTEDLANVQQELGEKARVKRKKTKKSGLCVLEHNSVEV